MHTKKSKWKTWHIIVLSIIALSFFGIFRLIGNAKPAETKVELHTKQSDSTDRLHQIESQFSAWDGSHKKLVEFIKTKMNDPESFKHVTTRYWDNGSDTIIIKMTYRGRNAYGGTVTNTVKATALLTGDLIEVNQQ